MSRGIIGGQGADLGVGEGHLGGVVSADLVCLLLQKLHRSQQDVRLVVQLLQNSVDRNGL